MPDWILEKFCELFFLNNLLVNGELTLIVQKTHTQKKTIYGDSMLCFSNSSTLRLCLITTQSSALTLNNNSKWAYRGLCPCGMVYTAQGLNISGMQSHTHTDKKCGIF